MKRILEILSIIFIIIMIIGIAYVQSGNKKEIVQPVSQMYVSVSKIIPESITLTRQYIGHVQAIRSVSVKPYISGFIGDVLVQGGQEVHIGETLFTLQQDQYFAEVESAEAEVAASEAELEKARLYLERVQRTAGKAISATEMDNARTSFLTAEANVANAKARLKVAMVNYDYTTIQATINGVVGNITVTPGEYVSPQSPALAYILQYNPIRVVFYMPDKEFLSLGADVDFFKTGLLQLKLADGEIFEAKGSVLFADNKITENTSAIALFADFENPHKKLLPNAYVTVLYDQNIKDALTVDRTWIHLLPDGDFVYVLRDGRIAKVKIKLGGSLQNRVYVSEGLYPDDLVITEPISNNQIGREAMPREE